MKKIISKATIISALASLLMVAGVNAAATGNVLTLEATQDAATGEVSIAGTTDASVLAVSCSLLDADDTEVFFGSLAVDEAKFEGGGMSLPVAEYTIKCANYEGGEWVSATIEIVGEEPEIPAEETKADSPNTGHVTNEEGASASNDTLIPAMVAIFIGAVIIAGTTAMVFRFRKNEK